MNVAVTIRQWVNHNIIHHIAEETEVHAIWKKLEAMHVKNTSRDKAMIIKRLVNLKYREEHSVTEHTSELSQSID